MFYQNHSLALRSYSGDIWKFNFKKSLDLDLEILDWLTGLGLTLWTTGTGLKKYLNYLAGLGFVLYYIRVRLEKYLDYLGFELVLWYIGLGLNTWLGLSYWTQIDFIITNQGCWKRLKTYLNYLLSI